MNRFGIDRAAVTSLRGLHGDWRDANAETLALTMAHADRLVPLACMSPMKGGGAEALRELAADGFRGIRLYPLLLHGYSLHSRFADAVADAAGELGIPVIIPTRPMMNFRFSTLPIDDVADLAQRHPGTTFLLSGPNYLSEFRATIEALVRCANLLVEISCMQAFRAVSSLVAEVGADRVLFGTGAVLHYPACNVAKLDHADLPPDHRRAIAAENAARLLGLRP
jgi:hypothetical protein